MKCIYCTNFSTKDHREHSAVGLGLCAVLTADRGHKVFVGWEFGCAKAVQVSDVWPRDAWIAKRGQKA